MTAAAHGDGDVGGDIDRSIVASSIFLFLEQSKIYLCESVGFLKAGQENVPSMAMAVRHNTGMTMLDWYK